MTYSLLMPCFGCSTSDTRDTAAVSQISTFGTALDAYKIDVGNYPQGQQGLGNLLAPNGAANWNGPYIKADSIPNDPWGNSYVYECPGKHNPNSYDLMSMGKDGQVGGGDDVTNWKTK